MEKSERLYIREGASIHKAAGIHEGDPPPLWITAAAIQNKVPRNRYFYTVPQLDWLKFNQKIDKVPDSRLA